MKTRNGKIARLPLEIREQLNVRLADGEAGNRLVEWLNSNPDVQMIMAEQFEGRPITDNNLSEWRAGGYAEWLTLDAFLDETRVLSENAEALADAGISSDRLHIVLLAHHAHLLKNLETMPENEFNTRLNTVRKLTASIMNMRRDELQKARLELQRERLEFLREKESVKSASSYKAAASGSVNARPPAAQTTEPATPAPTPFRPEIRPSAEWRRDADPTPPLFSLAPKPSSKIPILFGRIHPDFPVSGSKLPRLCNLRSAFSETLSHGAFRFPVAHHWSDSVVLDEWAPLFNRPARTSHADFPISALRSPISQDWSDSVGSTPIYPPKLAA